MDGCGYESLQTCCLRSCGSSKWFSKWASRWTSRYRNTVLVNRSTLEGRVLSRSRTVTPSAVLSPLRPVSVLLKRYCRATNRYVRCPNNDIYWER